MSDNTGVRIRGSGPSCCIIFQQLFAGMIYFTVFKNTPIIRREVEGFARRSVSVLGVIFKLTTLLFLAPFHRPRYPLAETASLVVGKSKPFYLLGWIIVFTDCCMRCNQHSAIISVQPFM